MESNQTEIRWRTLSCNPAIFEYDYERMKEHKADLKRELMEEMYRPERVCKFLKNGGRIDDYLN